MSFREFIVREYWEVEDHHSGGARDRRIRLLELVGKHKIARQAPSKTGWEAAGT